MLSNGMRSWSAMLLDIKLVLEPCIQKHITNQAKEKHTHTLNCSASSVHRCRPNLCTFEVSKTERN